MKTTKCISKDKSLIIETINPIITRIAEKNAPWKELISGNAGLIFEGNKRTIMSFAPNARFNDDDSIKAIGSFNFTFQEKEISPETTFDVYELVKDSNFIKLFNSFNTDFEKLIMTQAQIMHFCEKYANYLEQHNLFFMKSKHYDDYFYVIVCVSLYPEEKKGLKAFILPIGQIIKLRASDRYRIVVPR